MGMDQDVISSFVLPISFLSAFNLSKASMYLISSDYA